MVDINEIYISNSNWLKSADLQGTMQRVTIQSVEQGMVGEKTQIILTFVGKEKRLGLNVTNARTIADAFGSETDNWIGGEIILFSMKVDFQGKMVDGIRIRIPPPKAPGKVAIASNARDRAVAEMQTAPPVAAYDDGLDDSIPF